MGKILSNKIYMTRKGNQVIAGSKISSDDNQIIFEWIIDLNISQAGFQKQLGKTDDSEDYIEYVFDDGGQSESIRLINFNSEEYIVSESIKNKQLIVYFIDKSLSLNKENPLFEMAK
jgi:hypothetical protein